MKNYFPEIPANQSEPPSVDAYRTLGMMTYLDLDYLQGHSEQQIGDYYKRLLLHRKSATSFVVIGDENRPIGYATWNVDPKTVDAIEITRQAAPFGDHLHVQRSLRKHLPHIRTATSINERSARRKQVAW